jgi:hypothetical protein
MTRQRHAGHKLDGRLTPSPRHETESPHMSVIDTPELGGARVTLTPGSTLHVGRLADSVRPDVVGLLRAPSATTPLAN